MRLCAILLLALLAVWLSLPAAYAGGNLTVVGSSLAPTYINSNSTALLLNLTLNVTPGSGDGSVNITSINVTIAGSVVGNTTGNITAVSVRNETGTALATNITINASINMTKLTLPNGFVVTTAANRSAVIVFNISSTARKFATVAASINLSRDVGTSAPDNVTISGTNTSTASQIQDLRAYAAVSPLFADTNVTNQTFIYNITVTGSDVIDNFTITLPANYTILNVTNITHSPGTLLNSTFKDSTLGSTPTLTQNTVFVSRTGGFSTSSGTVRVVFMMNTNTSRVDASNFSSALNGSNLTSIATDSSSSDTIVTTQQLLRIENILITKNAAIINDTDFWEFNFTINWTANASGFLQFKMDNWNNSAGQVMNLTNGTRSYATLRNESNFSTANKLNVTASYDITQGVSFPSTTPGTAGTVRTLVLRMVIPSGTPIAANWFTSFNTLFRPFA